MSDNRKIRELAWHRLWADHWFGRLFGGGLLLGLCGYVVQVILSEILGSLQVQSWMDYVQAVAQHRQDLTTPIPTLTPDFISQATSSTVLMLFLGYIMTGIATYGGAVILLRCLKNESQGWLKAAFGGFAMPFGLLWLFIRYLFAFVGWSLVAFGVPGIVAGVAYPFLKTLPVEQLAIMVGIGTAFGFGWAIFFFCLPFYRYRFLFLIKAEHPDWSAGMCMKTCRELMAGKMMRSFKLDCSYWKPITWLLLLLVLSIAVPWILGMVVIISFVVISQYISVGQGFLYEELKAERSAVGFPRQVPVEELRG